MKKHICKFKIDKITYSKSKSRTKYDVSKNKSSMYPYQLELVKLIAYR